MAATYGAVPAVTQEQAGGWGPQILPCAVGQVPSPVGRCRHRSSRSLATVAAGMQRGRLSSHALK